MKALERYVKKNGKDPYGSTAPKGPSKGPKGVEMSDQYADGEGKAVFEDGDTSPETTGTKEGMKGYESVKGYGDKKKKQRSYLNSD